MYLLPDRAECIPIHIVHMLLLKQKKMHKKCIFSSEFTKCVSNCVKCVGVAMGRTSFYSTVCEIIFLTFIEILPQECDSTIIQVPSLCACNELPLSLFK